MKFEPIVTVIEETKDLSTLSMIELMSTLESYEKRVSHEMRNCHR